MKKALLVYPHNFLKKDMGTNVRVYQIVKHIRELGIQVDLFSLDNLISDFKNFDSDNNEGLVSNLYLHDFTEIVLHQRKDIPYRVKKKIGRVDALTEWVTPRMWRQFSEIVKNGYDFVIMMYAYTANLLKGQSSLKNVEKIYFMEDFLTMSHFASGQSKRVGKMFDEEIGRLSLFDKIVCISSDEKNLFERIFPEKSFYFLPHLIPKHENGDVPKDIDVLFLGHDNPFNIAGLKWFMEEIVPFVDKRNRIVVAGKMTSGFTSDRENVEVRGYIDDLDEIYRKAKCVVCPLLNGTGMKIKVIEAMSYGIPIICTSRGVDGLEDKYQNGIIVCNDPKEFADKINQLLGDESFYAERKQRICEYFDDFLSLDVNKKTLKEVFFDAK